MSKALATKTPDLARGVWWWLFGGSLWSGVLWGLRVSRGEGLLRSVWWLLKAIGPWNKLKDGVLAFELLLLLNLVS